MSDTTNQSSHPRQGQAANRNTYTLLSPETTAGWTKEKFIGAFQERIDGSHDSHKRKFESWKKKALEPNMTAADIRELIRVDHDKRTKNKNNSRRRLRELRRNGETSTRAATLPDYPPTFAETETGTERSTSETMPPRKRLASTTSTSSTATRKAPVTLKKHTPSTPVATPPSVRGTSSSLGPSRLKSKSESVSVTTPPRKKVASAVDTSSTTYKNASVPQKNQTLNTPVGIRGISSSQRPSNPVNPVSMRNMSSSTARQPEAAPVNARGGEGSRHRNNYDERTKKEFEQTSTTPVDTNLPPHWEGIRQDSDLYGLGGSPDDELSKLLAKQLLRQE